MLDAADQDCLYVFLTQKWIRRTMSALRYFWLSIGFKGPGLPLSTSGTVLDSVDQDLHSTGFSGPGLSLDTSGAVLDSADHDWHSIGFNGPCLLLGISGSVLDSVDQDLHSAGFSRPGLAQYWIQRTISAFRSFWPSIGLS